MQSPASSVPSSSSSGRGFFSCVLGKKSLGLLRRTLLCLSKIASEVNIESTAESLLLRALAPSHAAFTIVTLKREYFTPGSFTSTPEPSSAALINQTQATQTQSQAPTYIKCKVALKHMLLVFRNSAHGERMLLELKPELEKMFCTVQVSGVESKYGIPFEHQTNILQADFHGQADCSYLLFKPAVLHNAIEKFSARMTEVTLSIDANRDDEMNDGDQPQQNQPMIRLKNFDQAGAAGTTGMALLQESINTESSIPQGQIEKCHFAHPGESTELTFNVKEVRAFLSYVDGLVDFDVKLHYQTSGDPIMLDMRLRHAYGGPEDPMGTQAVQGPMEMKLVVATLADPQTASHQPTPQPAGQPATPNSQQHLRGSQQAQIEASFQQKQSAAAIVGEATRDDMSVPATPQE